MMDKRPISFAKLRTVPRQFSWVDQRLVRERYIDQLTPEACALYLFLVTVADAQGLSYYAERSLCLVAYDHPLSQVLALEARPRSPIPEASRMASSEAPMALKDIFKHIAETLS